MVGNDVIHQEELRTEIHVAEALVYWEPGPIEGDGRQPFGPLPVGEGVAGATWPLPPSLLVDQSSCIVSAITPAQRLCDATALIFCNVIDDSLSLVDER